MRPSLAAPSLAAPSHRALLAAALLATALLSNVLAACGPGDGSNRGSPPCLSGSAGPCTDSGAASTGAQPGSGGAGGSATASGGSSGAGGTTTASGGASSGSGGTGGAGGTAGTPTTDAGTTSAAPWSGTCAYSSCDPATQTGCSATEKCTMTTNDAGVFVTACCTNGTVAAGQPCDATGTTLTTDNCVAGQMCGGLTGQNACHAYCTLGGPQCASCYAFSSSGLPIFAQLPLTLGVCQ